MMMNAIRTPPVVAAAAASRASAPALKAPNSPALDRRARAGSQFEEEAHIVKLKSRRPSSSCWLTR